MINLNDPTIWTLISSNLANQYRVIPVKKDGDTVVFLAGDFLTPAQRAKTTQLLSMRLGRPVTLETLAAYPQLRQDEFDKLLNKYYGILPDPKISLPVGSDMMTVFLVYADPARRARHAASLKSKGFQVIEFGNPDDVLVYLRGNCCRPGRLVVSEEVLRLHGPELQTLAEMVGAELTTRLPTGHLVLSDS